MAYSTQDQLESNVQFYDVSYSDGAAKTAIFTGREALAKKIIQIDFSNVLDFDSIPDDTTTPVVNLLSQYKTAEMTLRRLVGIKRTDTVADEIAEWERLYNELKEKIISGELAVELSDGTSVLNTNSTFENTSRVNTKPKFGYDRYGRWLDNGDMTSLRGDVDDSTMIENGEYDEP